MLLEKGERALESHLLDSGGDGAGAEIAAEGWGQQDDMVVVQVGQHAGQDGEELLFRHVLGDPGTVDVMQFPPVDRFGREEGVVSIEGLPEGFEDLVRRCRGRLGPDRWTRHQCQKHRQDDRDSHFGYPRKEGIDVGLRMINSCNYYTIDPVSVLRAISVPGRSARRSRDTESLDVP